MREKPSKKENLFPMMMSGENWVLVVTPDVRKALKHFPRSDQESIDTAIVGMRDDPYYGDVQKISGGKNAWRRRVGSYRISYEIHRDSRTVIVFQVKRRTSTTY